MKIDEGGIFTSPVLGSAAPFKEALVSWNVLVPKEAGLIVELKVRRLADERWSPWLFVGEWGVVDHDVRRKTEFGEARIDTDYLTGDVDFDSIRVRFSALGTGALELHRFDLCLTRSAASQTRSKVVNRRREPTSLDVPCRSQRVEDMSIADRICSPTSVAMVMEYRGVVEATGDVARRLYDERHDIYGNWTSAIQGAFSFGVPGYLRRFADLDEVQQVLAKGQPVIASIRTPPGGLTGAPYVSTSGHLLVIVGFDEAGNVIVNDPAAAVPAGVRRTYPRAELARAWMGKGGVAYVFLER